MDFKKPSGTIWLALACLCLSVGGALAARTGGKGPEAAGQTYFQPSPSGPVTERAARARGEAGANRWDKGFWFAFGIRRLMGEHSTMGWHPWGGPGQHATLDDLVNGRKTSLEKKVANDQLARGTAASMPEAARAFAARRRGEEPDRLVMKDVAILVRMTAGDAGFPADIRVSNLDLPFDLEGLPFVWAGMATHAESLAYLMPLYSKAAGRHDKLSVLWAIGLHREPGAVVPFVERVLAGKECEEIRAEAAQCLGEQNDPKALDLLLRTINSDPSAEVREAAIHAFADLPGRSGLAHLVNLAKTHPEGAVRTEAVAAIGEVGGAEAVKVLTELARGRRN